jgi:hypothetical protein
MRNAQRFIHRFAHSQPTVRDVVRMPMLLNKRLPINNKIFFRR